MISCHSTVGATNGSDSSWWKGRIGDGPLGVFPAAYTQKKTITVTVPGGTRTRDASPERAGPPSFLLPIHFVDVMQLRTAVVPALSRSPPQELVFQRSPQYVASHTPPRVVGWNGIMRYPESAGSAGIGGSVECGAFFRVVPYGMPIWDKCLMP